MILGDATVASAATVATFAPVASATSGASGVFATAVGPTVPAAASSTAEFRQSTSISAAVNRLPADWPGVVTDEEENYVRLLSTMGNKEEPSAKVREFDFEGSQFEEVVQVRLLEFLDLQGVINPGEYGFRAGHSTVMAVQDMVERVRGRGIVRGRPWGSS
jgi:hypothetical protein